VGDDEKEESPLAILYDAILENKSLDSVGLYHSDVHYARAAIQYNTGIRLTLAETHQYLVEEGMIKSL